MFVKICGVRSESDVTVAADAGAHAVGLVLCPSVRRVDEALARRLRAAAPPGVLAVGVFSATPAEDVVRTARLVGLDVVQLHGPYGRADFATVHRAGLRSWRATSLHQRPDLRVGAFGEEILLLDAPTAGAGVRWDLAGLRRERPAGRWLLAGGLDPDNVREAVRTVVPWGVDVSSGVESERGVKDHGRIREFVAAANTSDPRGRAHHCPEELT